MKRRWTSFVIAAALLTTASASAYNDPFCDMGQCLSNGDLNVFFGSGWRQDSLNYTTQVGSDFHSNTQYNGIRSWNFGGRAEYVTCGLLTRVYGQYGAIYSGHSIRTTFADSDPINPNSIFNYQSDRGEVFDFGGVVGIPLAATVKCVNFVVSPLFGWSQHEQHFQQLLQEPVLNPEYDNPVFATIGSNIPHVYNSYQTRWNGVYTGYELAIEVPCTDLTVWTGFEWHWPKFTSRGQVNSDETDVFFPAGVFQQTLAQQKIDQTQKKWGNGWVLRFGADWQLQDCWSVGLVSYYSRYSVANAREDLVDVLGGEEAVGSVTNLTWISWSIMGAIGYQF